jgi:4-hydroxy-2-oxoglutarate aldolase
LNPSQQANERATAPPVSSLFAKLCSGVLLPFTTPFDAEGEVDLRAVRANLELWNRAGVMGYVALGSTGERVHLNEAERLRVVRAARETVSDQLAFVVGVGHQSTRETISETKVVASAGADAVLALTPHFYREAMTGEAFFQHFSTLADASPVPVILYNMPQNTGVTLAPEVAARLAEHENIVGIKDSSGHLLSLMEIIRLTGGSETGFVVMTGHGGALYPALCAGAQGAILAIGCIAPHLAVAVYESVRAGEHERARQVQEKMSALTKGILARYGIGGLKAALDLLGYAGGHVRAPLQAPDEKGRREIANILKECELLGGDANEREESRLAGASIK